MKIAKLILNWNNNELTSNLLKEFPEAIIVDNGSDIPHPDAKIRFDTNLGFTKGWNEAIKRVYDDYDAFLLMNNDIQTEHIMIDKLEWLLENKPRLGITSAYCNSPHKIMEKKTDSGLRYTPFVEFVAPLIRKTVFDKIGFFDEEFTHGWGVEFDYCWRARRNGFAVGIFDLVGMRHLEHKSIDKFGRDQYFKEANSEMQNGLIKRYGPLWRRDLETMIGLTMVVCTEERDLPKMLDYNAPLVDEIVIAVQKSKDSTLEIAKNRADTVLDVPCTGYCESHREITSVYTQSDWQLCLDADEYATPEFIKVMRELPYRGPMGYRLGRRLFMDGVFTWQGDAHHRFYNRNNVKFLDELHTEPQAHDWSKVSPLEGISIDHKKTTADQVSDELRYAELIENLYKGSSTYEAKKALNIHLNTKEE